jgi:capsule polysaccharide export protein KpsE/RkpR
MIVGIISFIFLYFFISSSYKSESILDVSLNEKESISSSLVSSIIPSSGATDSFQVKLFLESEEASLIFRSRVNIESLFQNEKITYFSKFRESRIQTFHDYIQNKLNILVDGDSNTLIIQTNAFSSKDAKNINLHLINMTADFFNKKSKLASSNARSNKICELYSANAGILRMDDLYISEDYSIVDKSSSANELLVTKAELYKEQCLSQLENTSLTNDEKLNFLKIPSFELRNINAEASKKIITDLYQKSMDAVSETDYMEIIAEPIEPDQPENKMALIYSVLIMIITWIVILGIKIIVRLSDEFSA